jgi:ABC-type branched-subunit amino acid transport system permease subunit
MTTIIKCIAAAIGVFVLARNGLVIGGAFIISGTIIGAVFYALVDYWMEQVRRQYRWEDVFIISRHYKTGAEFESPDDLKGVVIWCNYRDVMRRARQEEESIAPSWQ